MLTHFREALKRELRRSSAAVTPAFPKDLSKGTRGGPPVHYNPGYRGTHGECSIDSAVEAEASARDRGARGRA